MNTGAALFFVIDTVFNFYAFIVLARFLLQMVRADFYNPISQFTVKATNPVLVPLRRIIPGLGGVDVAAIVLIVLLMVLKVITFYFLGLLGIPLEPLYIAIITGKETASLVLNFFTFTIFIQVILSWVAQGQYGNPMVEILNQVTEPVLGPFRKLIPPMGGMDFSPMVALLVLYVIKILFGL